MLSQEERERERLLFEAERKRLPELFVREPMIDGESFLRWVGIEGLEPNRPLGYLKLLPQDFIVEEVLPDSTLITVDPGPLFGTDVAEGQTYYAELVKVGVDTLAAKEQMAHFLEVEPKDIGYAGIKDRLALTAQKISIRGVKDKNKFSQINADNFFLKNVTRGKGVIANGDLKGNRFTILLRSAAPFTEKIVFEMQAKVEAVKQKGFWNFFYFQRFGTPRLISHWLGLLLLKSDYEETVKTFITYSAARELPYFRQLREAAKKNWGKWNEIKKLFEHFPYHFQHELVFLNHLIERPTDFLGALKQLPDQVRLWMYAYDCFLFNRKLSGLIQGKERVPDVLPLITSFNPSDWEPYADFLRADGVKLPSQSYKNFPFIRVESRAWPTIQRVEINGTAFKGRFAAFSFSLPKGSYATTFLMNFFTLTSGLPLVAGIPTDVIDVREMLGMGSLASNLKPFQKVLEERYTDVQKGLSAE